MHPPGGAFWVPVTRPVAAEPAMKERILTARRVLFLLLCAFGGLMVPVVMWFRAAMSVHSSTKGSVIVVVILTLIVIAAATKAR
jgi:hypothetical protein